MRIVCDTNVLVRAAINPNGLAGELLKRIRASHTLVLSLAILAEVLEVLGRPRIQALHGQDKHRVQRYVSVLYKAAVVIDVPQPIPRVVPHDPKDDAILVTAIGGKADVLTTRDRHLFHPRVLAIGAAYGLRIVGDDALLAELRGH